MPCYEGKPNPDSKDATKRKPTPTPIFTISDDIDSSDISTSDDSLLGTDRNTNFRYPVLIAAEDVALPDSEDGIVLYLHDISYMREAVKQAEKEEENASTIESSDVIILVGDNSVRAGTSSNSSLQVAPTVSLMNLLEDDSGDGSTASLTVRAASAGRSAADNGETSFSRPSSR